MSSPFLIQGPNLTKGKVNRLGFDWPVSIDRFRHQKLHINAYHQRIIIRLSAKDMALPFA